MVTTKLSLVKNNLQHGGRLQPGIREGSSPFPNASGNAAVSQVLWGLQSLGALWMALN